MQHLVISQVECGFVYEYRCTFRWFLCLPRGRKIRRRTCGGHNHPSVMSPANNHSGTIRRMTTIVPTGHACLEIRSHFEEVEKYQCSPFCITSPLKSDATRQSYACSIYAVKRSSVEGTCSDGLFYGQWTSWLVGVGGTSFQLFVVSWSCSRLTRTAVFLT